MKLNRRHLLASAVLGIAAGTAKPIAAQKRYDRGATDSEIKIGNMVPYSGPASAYGVTAKTIAAYFNKINADGGINGRTVAFISYDDAYSPPKTVEQARRLVESDEVLLIFYSLGTPTNTAIQKYMNARRVPQLFVASGDAKWNDPRRFPWTMGWSPSNQGEGRIYGRYLVGNHPNGKVAVLYQNDDFGKDYLKGLTEGLAGRIPIVAQAPYETTDPTIDTQIVALSASGADIFFNVTTPKFAAQAIKKVAEIGWHPVHFLGNVSRSIGAVLRPAGFRNAQGIVSAGYTKDATDVTWKDDPAFKEWSAFMDQYYPGGDKTDSITVISYTVAQTLVQVLKQCGDDLTRQNVMKQATSLKNLQLGMLLPGITINTGPDDYAPIKHMQMMRFESERWQLFGPVLSGESGGT